MCASPYTQLSPPFWPLYDVQRWVLVARPPLAGWNLVRMSPFSHCFPLWPLYNVQRWVLVTRSLLGSRWGAIHFQPLYNVQRWVLVARPPLAGLEIGNHDKLTTFPSPPLSQAIVQQAMVGPGSPSASGECWRGSGHFPMSNGRLLLPARCPEIACDLWSSRLAISFILCPCFCSHLVQLTFA